MLPMNEITAPTPTITPSTPTEQTISGSKFAQLRTMAFEKKYLPFSLSVVLLLIVLVFYGTTAFFKQPAPPLATSGIQAMSNEVVFQGQQAVELTLQVPQEYQQMETNGIQLVAKITTDSQETLRFVPANIEGLTVLLNEIEKNDDGGIFRLGFGSAFPEFYTLKDQELTVGHFILPTDSSGTFTIEFIPSLSKIMSKDEQNMLIAPETYTRE